MAGEQGREIALDGAQLFVGFGAGQIPEYPTDLLQRLAGPLHGLDHIGEAWRRLIGDDGGDLGLVGGKRRVIGRAKMLGPDPVEGEQTEGGGPGFEKGIGGQGGLRVRHPGNLGSAGAHRKHQAFFQGFTSLTDHSPALSRQPRPCNC